MFVLTCAYLVHLSEFICDIYTQSSGRQISECKPDQPIADCTNEETLRDVGFNAYTEFFTHTQQICFHLQSQVC